MKKLLLVVSVALGAVTAWGQGAVTFANNSSTAISNSVTGARAVVGDFLVGLYGSTTLGLPSDATLTQIGASTGLLGTTGNPSGLFSGGTRNIGNPGDTVSLQVRSWSSSFATYELALAGGGLTGKSPKWEQVTGGGTLPTQPITGAGRLQSFSVGGGVVPEPSSIALGLLGLGAIVLFRRRK